MLESLFEQERVQQKENIFYILFNLFEREGEKIHMSTISTSFLFSIFFLPLSLFLFPPLSSIYS